METIKEDLEGDLCIFLMSHISSIMAILCMIQMVWDLGLSLIHTKVVGNLTTSIHAFVNVRQPRFINPINNLAKGSF